MWWNRTFHGALRAAACLAVVSALSVSALAAEDIKLGFLMPLTGGSGKLGNMMMAGADLAVEEINNAGGVAGRNIKLIPEDSQALAKNGIDGYRKLHDLDEVPVIITGWTAVVMALAPLAEQDRSFLLSASTASPAVRGVSPLFQSSWMYADDDAKRILPYARETLGIERLGLLTVVSDLGTGISEAIKSSWSGLGGEIVAEETHQMEESNFRSIVLKMLSAQPQAIYITSSNGKQSAQIVRQARELGYDGVFLSYGAFEDPEILEIGDKANNSYYSTPSFDANSDDPAVKSFVDAFVEKYGSKPNVHQANHYDLIKLYADIASSIESKRQEITGETFAQTLHKDFKTYRGAGGLYTFNFDDGSVTRSVFVKSVKDGEFIKVDDLN